MKVINVPCKNGDTKPLLDHLKGHVFHLTTQTGYNGILVEGGILHNKDKRFKLNTSSEDSFGRLNGYVCFFDLRNSDPDFIENVLGCYYFLRPPWFEKRDEGHTVWNLAYLILNPAYLEQLIPYNAVHDNSKVTGKLLRAIPYGEVWIENRVPIAWIETVLDLPPEN